MTLARKKAAKEPTRTRHDHSTFFELAVLRTGWMLSSSMHSSSTYFESWIMTAVSLCMKRSYVLCQPWFLLRLVVLQDCGWHDSITAYTTGPLIINLVTDNPHQNTGFECIAMAYCSKQGLEKSDWRSAGSHVWLSKNLDGWDVQVLQCTASRRLIPSSTSACHAASFQALVSILFLPQFQAQWLRLSSLSQVRFSDCSMIGELHSHSQV